MRSDADFDDYLETLAEPYRTKVVERIRLPSRAERAAVLKRAWYSPAYLQAVDVYIDFASDSGTGAMSDEQWAALMRGDESYVRSRSFSAFEAAVREVTGYEHVIPTHQGRGAEHIAAELLVEPGNIVLCNTLFDTTRANVAHRKGIALDLMGDCLWAFGEPQPFKGNFDLAKLSVALERYHERVPFIAITVLNNMACSSPVSMENIRETRRLADRYRIPIYFDAARFAENAYFIKTRELGFESRTVADIAREMFSYGDGCWMSAKKDAIVNIGGFLALRDEKLARRCQERLVLYEGFPTYGGLAGRDLEAIAVGLREGLDEEYLSHRTRLVAKLGQLFEDDAGVLVSQPVGGSAVFVDVESVYPHLGPDELAPIALSCDLYLEGGIRAGAMPMPIRTVSAESGEMIDRVLQVARFAVPRRVYSRSHMEYVAKVLARVKERAHENRGYRIVEMPEVLGHFFAKFEPLPRS